jgi:hypothetical protein
MLEALGGFADANASHPAPPPAAKEQIDVDAVAFTSRVDRQGMGWRKILGLGRGEGAIVVQPFTRAAFSLADARARAPRIDYRVIAAAGAWQLRMDMLPVFPIRDGRGLRIGVSVDGGPLREVAIETIVGSPAWGRAVLDNKLSAELEISLAGAGEHRISLFLLEPGVVIDGLSFSR